MDKCENCGRVIGRLETPQLHDDHIVCVECKERLLKASRASTEPVREIHVETPRAGAQDDPVWKNMKWLGLGMFALGRWPRQAAPAAGATSD
jgi:hypothetical protein